MSRALCKFGRKKRGVRDDIKYTCTNLKVVRLDIARTHGWVELAPMVPTSSSHRSSTVYVNVSMDRSWILCRNDSSISPVMRSLGNFHQYISPGIT